MMDKVKRFLAAVSMLMIPACHMFEDADNVDPCPLNSGYPCPCSVESSGGYCDDASHCLAEGGDDFGMCTWPCATSGQCSERQSFGVEGLCASVGDLKYCQLVCEDPQGYEGYCPPGMVCDWLPGGSDYAICSPAF